MDCTRHLQLCLSTASNSCLINPRTYMQLTPPPWYKVRGGGGWNPPSVFVTLRYFEKFLPLIDSVLCRLQDDVNIMGTFANNDALGQWRHPIWRIFLNFSLFPLYFPFLPENLTFYSENTLFNSLACKRCSNTSLCCFTTTSGLEYGPLKAYNIIK